MLRAMTRWLSAGAIIAGAMAVGGAASGLPSGPQQPAIESHISLTADGTAPFDVSDSGGEDSAPDNGVVRNFDTLAFKVIVAVNDGSDSNVFAEVVLEGPARWTAVPLECLTTASGFNVTPDSELIDSDGDGLAETLVCNLGSKAEGSKVSFEPLAQAVGSNGDTIGAAVSGDSDNNVNHGSPTAEHLTDEVEISAGFGVSIDETLQGFPPADKIKYRPTHVPQSKYGREGWVLDWRFVLSYDTGSEFVANNNGLADFVFDLTWLGSHDGCTTVGTGDCLVEGDNANGVFADGVVPLGIVSGNASDSCSLSSGDGSVSCSQANPGEKVVVEVSDRSVNSWPLVEVDVKMFYPKDTLFDPNGFSSLEIYNVEQTVTLVDWSGAGPLLTSVSGQTDLGPETDLEDWPLQAGQFGASYRFRKSFDQDDASKSGARAGARGEIIETSIWLYDRRTKDSEMGVCDTLDTDSFEFAGAIMPGPGQKSGRFHGQPWVGNNLDPNSSAGIGVHDVANPVLIVAFDGNWGHASDPDVTVEFSDVDYAATGDDHWSATCEDDLDGDGIYDWVDSWDDLAGGAPSVVRIRMVWDRNLARINQRYSPFGPSHAFFSFDLKIKQSAAIGSQLPNVAATNLDGAGWTHSYGTFSQDPNDPLFSYGSVADRVLVLPTSMNISKTVVHPGPFQPGDIAEFKITPATAGSNAQNIELYITDTLPAQLELVSQDCEQVFAALAATCSTSVSGRTISWTVSGYQVGDPLPTITLQARLSDGTASGVYTNSVAINSSFAALSDDTHCDAISHVDPVQQDRMQSSCRLAVARSLTDGASVNVVGESGFRISKGGDADGPDVGGEFVFTLDHSNLGGPALETVRLIDVLPFNGDGLGDGLSHSASGIGGVERHNTDVQGSSFDATFTSDPLGRAHFVAIDGDHDAVRFTTDPSDSLDLRPCHPMHWDAGVSGDTDPNVSALCHDGLINPKTDKPAMDVEGTGAVEWLDAKPADPSEITAVMIDISDVVAGVESKSELTLSVGEAVPGNLFCNNFGAHASTLVFDVISNDVCVEVQGQVYDLALRKTVTSEKVAPGDLADYQIEVFNQGEGEVTNVVVSDTLPDGLTLEDSGWTDNGNGVVSTLIPGPLAPGDSVVVSLAARVSKLAGGTLVNTAEIVEMRDNTGTVVTDFDSIADSDHRNDDLVDDVIDGCSVCSVVDEDDHDVAVITVGGTLALTGTNLTVWLAALAALVLAAGKLVPLMRAAPFHR